MPYQGQKRARFDSRKFSLYHQTVKNVAIRILMARFKALEKERFIGVVREENNLKEEDEMNIQIHTYIHAVNTLEKLKKSSNSYK